METPGAHNVIALLDQAPVGLARGAPGEDGVAALYSMWVAPHCRGRGVGDRLIGAVSAWASRAGARVLRLVVLSGNEAAIALYTRNGFVPLPGERDGERMMEKPLR